MKKFSKKVISKAFVITLVISASIFMFKEKNSPAAQIDILASAVFIYLTWAIIYHHFDKSLTFTVFIEYVLTAVLALVLLTGVII